MPYMIQKDGERFCVHKQNADDTPGDQIACHDTEAEAQAQMVALYANEPSAAKSLTGGKMTDKQLQETRRVARLAAKSASMSQIVRLVTDACYRMNDRAQEQARNLVGPDMPINMEMLQVEDVYDDHAILSSSQAAFYSVPYSITAEGQVAFAPRVDWQPMTREWAPISLKSLTDTTATLAGYGVLFGGQDLQGEQFTPETDFALDLVPVKSIFHEHTLGSVKHALGKATTVAADDAGLWVEMELDRSRAYVKEILTLVEKGVLGLSSGSIQHLIRRAGKTITAWPIVEFSLTPTPAEPRTLGVEWVKSMMAEYPAFKAFLPEAGGEPAAGANGETMPQQATKSTTEVTKPMEITQEQLDKLAQDAGASAVKAVMELPAIKAGFAVQVTKDAGDQPFANLGEQLGAVKSFYLSGGMSLEPRLAKHAVKATGASEAIGSEGGFLLQPQFTADVLKPLHDTGAFTSRARRLPVSTGANSGWLNGVDETDRATGSRWGGIRGYRLAEGGTKTASKPAFRRINWQLKKFAVLCYATDELLADAAQLEAVIRQGASEELDFMANDDILNGAGNAGPLGILASPCLVTVDKETNQAGTTIVYENLTKMWARLHARSRGNAAWFYNQDCGGQLDTLVLAAGTGGLPPNFIRYGNDGILTIYGRPAIPTEFNATLGSVGDIVLADLSEYLYFEKGGIQEAQSIHVQFLTDETVFRLVYRCDGQPAWAAALTPYKGSATQSPFVALAVRA